MNYLKNIKKGIRIKDTFNYFIIIVIDSPKNGMVLIIGFIFIQHYQSAGGAHIIYELIGRKTYPYNAALFSVAFLKSGTN